MTEQNQDFADRSTDSPKIPEFSLFSGGLFARMMHGGQLRELHRGLWTSRVTILILIVWLPILVLSTFAGNLLPEENEVSFIWDLEAHVRFLLALPLLLIAERTAERRMRPLLEEFTARELIPNNQIELFRDAVASAYRLRNSVVAEISLIAFVYAIGIMVIWRQYVAVENTTWYMTAFSEGSRLTHAGMWYAFVSLPIFQFVLFRWYFKLFIWCRFLWRLSNIDLKLIPTHPDRAGGLGFLSEMSRAFLMLAFAHGVLLAGWLATRVIVLGVPLTDFKLEIGLVVLFMLFLTQAPLLVFLRQLRQTRRHGYREYGTFAMQYVRQFDDKWVRANAGKNEKLLGSSDIQSLADLGNSFDLVRRMNKTPIVADSILQIAVATLIPIAPLLLTIIPLEELIKKLASIVF